MGGGDEGGGRRERRRNRSARGREGERKRGEGRRTKGRRTNCSLQYVFFTTNKIYLHHNKKKCRKKTAKRNRGRGKNKEKGKRKEERSSCSIGNRRKERKRKNSFPLLFLAQRRVFDPPFPSRSPSLTFPYSPILSFVFVCHFLLPSLLHLSFYYLYFFLPYFHLFNKSRTDEGNTCTSRINLFALSLCFFS